MHTIERGMHWVNEDGKLYIHDVQHIDDNNNHKMNFLSPHSIPNFEKIFYPNAIDYYRCTARKSSIP